jgi:peptidoglycan/LPS O-acetylase OafA/YrhL
MASAATGAATLSDEAARQASGGIRYTELDALRGVAALTVIFHHFRWMWFENARPGWGMTLITPLTAGHQAVMLFFLLSGFVLAVPMLRGKGQAYPVYLTRRVLRIYGPYFFALLLAVAGAAVWHGHLPEGSWANMSWNEPVRPKLVLAHVLMIGNYNVAEFDNAFWSLVVEMRVSIIFPLMFFVVNRIKTWVALAGVLLGTVAAALIADRPNVFSLTPWTLGYAMVFVCGILLAKNVERVSAWYRGLRPLTRVAFAILSFVLYSWGMSFAEVEHRSFGQDQILVTLGAAGYMILALNAGWAKRALRTRVAQFLGRISYSLYLVHCTVLLALAHTLGQRVSVLTQFVFFVSLSIGLSYLFCIGVEEQFLKLSRWVGKRKLVLRNRAVPHHATIRTPFEGSR